MIKINSLWRVALGVAVTLLISTLFSSGCTNMGEIIVEKEVVGSPDLTEPDQEFAFILTGGPSALNLSFTLINDQSHFNTAVLPGDGYKVAESLLAGWDLTTATCDDGSPVDNIDVSPGETVTCTFENAKKVEIIIFTDYQCSHCWKLHSEVEGELLRLYVDTGKANMDVRLLPAFGYDSQLAAEATLCAADQGQFREYRDAIFTAWSQAGPAAYSEEELRGTANQLGLNEESFSACLDSGAKRAAIEDNMRLAEEAGTNEVPTVFINGVEVEKDALFMLESYIEIIEESLSK